MTVKQITSATVFNDAIGMRLSATYSEIDEDTGRIISDNQRFDRIITNSDIKAHANIILEYAQNNLPDK